MYVLVDKVEEIKHIKKIETALEEFKEVVDLLKEDILRNKKRTTETQAVATVASKAATRIVEKKDEIEFHNTHRSCALCDKYCQCFVDGTWVVEEGHCKMKDTPKRFQYTKCTMGGRRYRTPDQTQIAMAKEVHAKKAYKLKRQLKKLEEEFQLLNTAVVKSGRCCGGVCVVQ